ncbi:Chitin synthase, class 5 [Ascosphaera atra]|nr:Chitin synthase, class 5 [Ascosphaera atra]
MLVSLTVGKVDAGVAVLLTEDNRLIEFPSVLLPRNITSGSIVNINVSRNFSAEEASVINFKNLQDNILQKYGVHSPSPPVLRLRNATQTSIVLEWDPINLATASLRSLSLYRNDSKAGIIPRPLEMLSTKISGLAIDTEYTFHLVLRTSAGTYSSQKLKCRTHKMTDLSGITVTPGVMPPPVRDSLAAAVDRIGGRIVDTVRIDTTHFVCTESGGPQWEKAVQLNIPVVRPEWVDGCEREGTIVSVRGYYLNADPKLRQMGPNVRRQSSMTTTTSNTAATTPTTTAARPNESPLPPTPKESPAASANAAEEKGADAGKGQKAPGEGAGGEQAAGNEKQEQQQDGEKEKEEEKPSSQATEPPAVNVTSADEDQQQKQDQQDQQAQQTEIEQSNEGATGDDADRAATPTTPFPEGPTQSNREESPYTEDEKDLPPPPPKDEKGEGETKADDGEDAKEKQGLPTRSKDNGGREGSEGEKLEEVPL